MTSNALLNDLLSFSCYATSNALLVNCNALVLTSNAVLVKANALLIKTNDNAENSYCHQLNAANPSSSNTSLSLQICQVLPSQVVLLPILCSGYDKKTIFKEDGTGVLSRTNVREIKCHFTRNEKVDMDCTLQFDQDTRNTTYNDLLARQHVK